MAVVGDSTPGTGQFPTSAGRALASRFIAPSGGTITSARHYSAANTVAGANFKVVLMADSGGNPGNVVAVSSPGAMPAGGGWTSVDMTGTLIAGACWIGVVADSWQGYFGNDSAGGDLRMTNTFDFTVPPAAWTNEAANYAALLNVEITYTAEAGPPTPLVIPLWVDMF